MELPFSHPATFEIFESEALVKVLYMSFIFGLSEFPALLQSASHVLMREETAKDDN